MEPFEAPLFRENVDRFVFRMYIFKFLNSFKYSATVGLSVFHHCRRPADPVVP